MFWIKWLFFVGAAFARTRIIYSFILSFKAEDIMLPPKWARITEISSLYMFAFLSILEYMFA